MQVSTILESIDMGAVALPEFQRGYVWNRKQVRDFLYSLYRKRPVGSLLIWITPSESAPVRGNGQLQPGSVKLILDGQQRITTLYGIIKGKPPQFFDGNERAFTGLMFHLEEEVFEFYGPVKMRDDPYWIDVSKLMVEGLEPYIEHVTNTVELKQNLAPYIGRLNSINSIKEKEFHIEEVAGERIILDEVVEIFNNVNSGGTKLSKGDLALAKICAGWPEARNRMRSLLDQWREAGYNFKLDWLLRNITTVLTGQAFFSDLDEVSSEEFQDGLARAERAIDYLLNTISGRLGLAHNRVLGGRYAFPVMSRYVVDRGGKLTDAAERDKLLFWYINTFIWGRFTSSVETKLNQDLRTLADAPVDQVLDTLIEQLRISRGELVIRGENFSGWSLGARFYPLLYLLTRVGEAKDWGTGLPLKADMLGKGSRLHVHHIFPKSLLYKKKYSRSEVNSLANFCFLTHDTNLNISDRAPEDYFPEVMASFPGALESQWVPMDESFWRMDNYLDFLHARQELLADAANQFLNSLLDTKPEIIAEYEITIEPEVIKVFGGIESDEEERILRECNEWVLRMGLSEGDVAYELVNEEGELIALIDLAWPNGLQQGLSDPVAILIDESHEIEDLLNQMGYRYYTSIKDFRRYVNREILEIEDVVTGA